MHWKGESLLLQLLISTPNEVKSCFGNLSTTYTTEVTTIWLDHDVAQKQINKINLTVWINIMERKKKKKEKKHEAPSSLSSEAVNTSAVLHFRGKVQNCDTFLTNLASLLIQKSTPRWMISCCHSQVRD